MAKLGRIASSYTARAASEPCILFLHTPRPNTVFFCLSPLNSLLESGFAVSIVDRIRIPLVAGVEFLLPAFSSAPLCLYLLGSSHELVVPT